MNVDDVVDIIKNGKYNEIEEMDLIDVDNCDMDPLFEQALLKVNGLRNVADDYKDAWRAEAIHNTDRPGIDPVDRVRSIIRYYSHIGHSYLRCFGNTRFLFSHAI